MESFETKCERNSRVSARWDALMREGKHGHYETLFRVVREECERATEAAARRAVELCLAGSGEASYCWPTPEDLAAAISREFGLEPKP
jgi:hypothetical protein